jgi:hypothetical protein
MMPHSKGWRHRKDERTSHDTPIGDIVAGLMHEPLFARGVAVGKLAAEWEHIVGPRLASATSPRSLDGGTLIVAASSGPWGAQAGFLAAEIRVQANAALGNDVVRKVQIIVRPDPSNPL